MLNLPTISPLYFVISYLILSDSNLNLLKVSEAHCPIHCSMCLPTTISCINGGLSSIPMSLQPATDTIQLAGQLNFYGILTDGNFTGLAPPKFKIVNLSIKSSSIYELSSKTFTPLQNLKALDLSENQRLTIKASAFFNLHLTLLKLDDIGKLLLLKDCFEGLQVRSLSLKNSRLQSLEYDIFTPISLTLQNLYLENNQIRTIDQKFEPLFYRLETINVKDNPLICYCPLLWLSKTLRSKMLNDNLKNKFDEQSNYQSESNNFPKCVAPSYLRHRQLQSISESEFNCHVPKIAQIEVDIVSFTVGKMSCSIKQDPKGQKIPTKVFWEDDRLNNPNKKLQESFNSDGTLDHGDQGEVTAMLKFDTNKKETKNVRCVAENTAGRSSISVQLSWPLLFNHTREMSTKPSSLDLSKKDDDTSNFQTQFPTINRTSFLYNKQYTLLEMTAAIVGTFMFTVIVFLMFYKFYFQRNYGYKCGKKSLKYSLSREYRGSNKKSLVPYPSPRTGFAVYDGSVHYSDNSQTYDSIPHNSVFPQQHQPFFATISNSPSAHFIDYKTHKNLYPSSPSG